MLQLPPIISVDSLIDRRPIGSGRRATAWRCTWEGQQAVLKCYSRETDGKYRRRTGMSIARYEFAQNARAAAHPPLRDHVARPLAVVASTDDEEQPCEAFLQQYIPGELLSKVRRRCGISKELLESARLIVREMHSVGIYDFDFCAGNLLVRDGHTLTLFDFNILPRHLYFHNPLTWMGYKLRIVGPGNRDLHNLDRLAGPPRPAVKSQPNRAAA